MAYGKRYRRRYSRRGRRSLSNRTIYGKTSAKSQARQIATLRNQLGRLAKLTRHEIHNTQHVLSKTFTNSALSSVYETWTLPDDFMEGQWTKMRGFSLNGILEYGDNRAAYPDTDITRSGSVRILIYQNLQSRNSNNGLTSVLDIYSTGTDYELNTTRPLKDGVSSFVKILYDKTYTLSDQTPVKRVHIYLRKLLNLHKETTDSNARGSITVGVVTSGLHWTADGYYENIGVNLIAKQVYTED